MRRRSNFGADVLMQIAARSASVPSTIEEIITLRYRRVAQQIERVQVARTQIATLERNGHIELVQSSRMFLARMEGVLLQAQDDYRLAVQRRAAWLNSCGND